TQFQLLLQSLLQQQQTFSTTTYTPLLQIQIQLFTLVPTWTSYYYIYTMAFTLNFFLTVAVLVQATMTVAAPTMITPSAALTQTVGTLEARARYSPAVYTEVDYEEQSPIILGPVVGTKSP